MISILITSERGEYYDLATKLADERNVVKFWASPYQGIGEGIEKVKIITRDDTNGVSPVDLIITSPRTSRRTLTFMEDGRRVLDGGSLSLSLAKPEFIEGMKNLMQEMLEESEMYGVEVQIGGWFDGRGWTAFCLVFPETRFLEGGRGLYIKGMGCTSKFIPKCRLTDVTLNNLTSLVTSLQFRGYIHLSCVITERGVHLESAGTGSENGTFQSLSEGILSPLSEALYHTSFKTGQDWNIAVGLSLPPWPYNTNMLKEWKDKLVLDVIPEAAKHVWLEDVNSNGVAGVSGFLGYATARGKTLTSAKARVYNTISNIVSIPDVQYRKDIGSMSEIEMQRLNEWGWLDV